MTKKERIERKTRIETIRRNREALGYSTTKKIVDFMESVNRSMDLNDALSGYVKKGYTYELNDGLVVR